ncbi:SgcJ/EcaC family oxidoreductase [Aquamicrobium terrae]
MISESTDAPIQDPAEIAQQFADAWNARDAATLAELFAEDADFVNVVGLWWRKRRDIRKAHDYGLSTFFRAAHLIVEERRVRPMGDTVIVHARYRIEGQLTPEGSAADPRHSILVFVVRRQGSGWIAVAAQNTEVIPNTETFLAVTGSRNAVDYRKAR